MIGSISLGVVFVPLVSVVLGLGRGESEGKVRLKSFAVVLSLSYYVEPCR